MWDYRTEISLQPQMQDLRITLIQTDLYWENTIANLAMLRKKFTPSKVRRI
jgi:hypothetical protein